MPGYFNLPHSKVGNVNRTALTFFVFDPVDGMYATAYLFFTKLVFSKLSHCSAVVWSNTTDSTMQKSKVDTTFLAVLYIANECISNMSK